jgi:hypothetical protein
MDVGDVPARLILWAMPHQLDRPGRLGQSGGIAKGQAIAPTP